MTDLASVPQSIATDSIDISVVVPTYKRPELLRRCLEALANQDLAPDCFEIVVVDDGRSAETSSIIEGVRSRHPDLDIRLLQGAGRGPAAARNIGWRVARGSVIAFTDDDAYPAFDSWLSRGLGWFDGGTANGLSGRVIVPADGPLTDFQRNVKNLERSCFLTCNAFYRRDALERAGGFDERFAVPFREDSDLQFRIEALGGEMPSDDELIVFHPASEGSFGVSLKLQRYSMYNALLYKKHPLRYKEMAAGPPLSYYAILLAGGTGLASLLAGRRRLALLALGSYSLLEARFFAKRVRGTARSPRHLLDMAVTSLLIPPLSVYWRLRGAIKFRVFFL